MNFIDAILTQVVKFIFLYVRSCTFTTILLVNYYYEINHIIWCFKLILTQTFLMLAVDKQNTFTHSNSLSSIY